MAVKTEVFSFSYADEYTVELYKDKGHYGAHVYHNKALLLGYQVSMCETELSAGIEAGMAIAAHRAHRMSRPQEQL